MRQAVDDEAAAARGCDEEGEAEDEDGDLPLGIDIYEEDEKGDSWLYETRL